MDYSFKLLLLFLYRDVVLDGIGSYSLFVS